MNSGNFALILQLLALVCFVIAWWATPVPKDKPKRWEFMGFALLVLSFMIVGISISIGLHAVGR